ncbi:hypothetical protein BLX24_30000 [Arsenicibacter rosenii]|uniref:Uncharacterized protein n=1 Tax=Arsenicibacter rosenii TaxID=1750698 RepID=A0A1S2VAR2_9BACT|nr:hypothetical protein BLX24_30000 [Arsenicibacter rosenii]
MQERNRLIDAAREKAELEIKLANEEAESKIKLSKEETEQKIKDATEEKEKKIDLLKQLATADKDRAQELLKLAKDEADQKIKTAEAEKKKKLQMLADENRQRIQQKYDLEEQIADANEEARQTEIEQKRKAWQSQKKADIASALISGALATIKALASGIFPLNLVFAAVTAAMTAVQIAKIKSQPEPQFRYGGLMKGSSHGVTYGSGGLAIIDRSSGQERGEMEGDEAIISKEQTRANWPLISRMLENARTPGRRHTPVDRGPVAFRDGGMLEPKRYGEMYLFGSKKKKEAEAAAREAEAEAARASAEAEASAAEASSAASGYDTSGGSDVSGSAANEAEAKAAQEEAQKQGRMQLELLQNIVDSIGALDQNQQAAMNSLAGRLSASVDAMGQQVAGLNGGIMEVKGAVNGVEGATHQVKDAVYATNAQGKLDQLISAISSLG